MLHINISIPKKFKKCSNWKIFFLRKPVCSNFFLHPFVSFRQNLSRTASPCTWPRPRNKNIFLMETYKDFAIPKVLCTLESAARHNSDFCVTLFVSQHDPPRSHWPILQELGRLLPSPDCNCKVSKENFVPRNSRFDISVYNFLTP